MNTRIASSITLTSLNLIRKTVKPQPYLVTNKFTKTAKKIESLVKEQTSENTTRKTFSDVKTFQRYLSSVNKGNVDVLDLSAGDLDHLLAKFFKNVRKINADDYEPDALCDLHRSIHGFLSMAYLHSTFC